MVDCLFPLRQVAVEMTNLVFPEWVNWVTWAQPHRGFDARKCFGRASEEQPIPAAHLLGSGGVSIDLDGGVGFGDPGLP